MRVQSALAREFLSFQSPQPGMRALHTNNGKSLLAAHCFPPPTAILPEFPVVPGVPGSGDSHNPLSA